MGDEGNFFRPSTLAANIGYFVQNLDTRYNMTEDAGELGVHVRQDNTELRRHLKNKNKIHFKSRRLNHARYSIITFSGAILVL